MQPPFNFEEPFDLPEPIAWAPGTIGTAKTEIQGKSKARTVNRWTATVGAKQKRSGHRKTIQLIRDVIETLMVSKNHRLIWIRRSWKPTIHSNSSVPWCKKCLRTWVTPMPSRSLVRLFQPSSLRARHQRNLTHPRMVRPCWHMVLLPQ